MSDVGLHDSVPAAARALGEQAPQDDAAADVHFTWSWFETLQRHGIDRHSRVLALSVPASEGADGVAEAICLPLLQVPTDAAAAYGPTVTSLSNFYSSLYAPIATAEPALEALTAQLRRALRHLRRSGTPCAVLRLQPLDSEGSFAAAAAAALAAEGYRVDRFVCFGNWYLDVAGRSFEAYFPSVPSRIRNTIRRARKKLDDTGNWTLQIVQHPGPELDRAAADFLAVYARSWKVPEPHPEFMPNLIRMSAERGWLRLGVVRLGDVPLAAQVWFVHQQRAQIYKLAYDEEHKRWSGGSVLTAAMMQHVIDVDRVREVDYLTGDDAYKADWMSARRERIGLVAFRLQALQGLASAALHFGARWWRRLRPAPAATAATVATEAAQAPAVGKDATRPEA